MTPRFACVMVVAAGFCTSVAGQEVIRVTYSWIEVNAGSTHPSTQVGVAGNSIVDPGEGARMDLNLFIEKNGTNAIGQTTFFTPPPQPGTGIIKGLGAMLYKLAGDNGATTAAGVWSINRRFAPYVTTTNGWAGTSLGQAGPTTLDNFGTTQFAVPGSTANSINPLDSFFHAVWTPNSYASRVVNFRAAPGSAAPLGQHNSVLLRFNIAMPDPTDPTTWYDEYFAKFFDTDFGSGVNIPIAPAPPALAIVAFTVPFLGARRRR